MKAEKIEKSRNKKHSLKSGAMELVNHSLPDLTRGQIIEIINLTSSTCPDNVYNSSESNFSEKKIETSQLSVFDIRLRDIESELKALNLNYENLLQLMLIP